MISNRFVCLILMVCWQLNVLAQGMQKHHHEGECDSTELACASAASPAFLPNGDLLLIWSAGGTVSVAKSTDMGVTWKDRKTIANHRMFLDTGADARPQMVADENGHVLVAYAYFKDEHWNAKVNVAYSMDFGEHFSSVKPLLSAGVSERFPVLAYKGNSKVAIAWIDKRLVNERIKKGTVSSGASVAYTETADWGKTFDNEKWLQQESCECCRLGLVRDSRGEIYLANRAIFSGGVRDHAVLSIAEGLNVSPSVRVSDDQWQTDVCPHQGPALAVSPNGHVHVAWFTQGQKRKGLFYAHASMLGDGFSTPMQVGRGPFNPSRPYLLASEHRLWMVWKEYDGLGSIVQGMHSDDEGLTWSDPQSIASTDGFSDHPILIQFNGQVYLSWLTRKIGYRLIKLED